MILLLIFILINESLTCYAFEPKINGKSGVLIETKSGRLLYSYNAHLKLPMASTTKIMTALVAIENGNLNDIVKVDRSSVGIEGSSIYLRPGEEITLKDLLYGLMLRSGNDSAIAIAKHVGGTVDNFIKMMNKKAKEIGAYNTNFTNPHGLHNDNHYTTAYDLALITREAMKYDTFKEIVKTKVWVANRNVNRYFYNKNKTLWQYNGGDGVKIGYTKRAGRCLVASATRDNMQLIAVVLNDSTWFNDCYRLFDYGFKNYRPFVIHEKGQFVRSVYVPNGKRDILPIVVKDSLIIPLRDEEKNTIKTVIKLPKRLNAPINEGQLVGAIEIYMQGKLIHKGDLIAKESIEEKTMLDKIMETILNIFR
jgi:D-alanyl-D-alanine carboxypeptidase (penicillin-binding protein 5/6)